MTVTLKVRDATFGEVEASVRAILSEIDRGLHDDALKAAGVSRPGPVSDAVTLSDGQGLSPDQWLEILVDFSPLIATVAEDIWKIVVAPRLERIFRADRVKTSEDR